MRLPALCALAFGARSAEGVQSYADLIPNGRRVVDRGVLWPGVGHTLSAPVAGNSVLDSFGTAFVAAGKQWTVALCNADSDGDGFSNGQELGDPTCVWTPGTAAAAAGTISNPGSADSTPASNAAAVITPAPPVPAATPSPPVPVAATQLPLSTQVSSGGSPGSSTNGVANNAGIVRVATASEGSCRRGIKSYTIPIADGLCRELSASPNTGAAEYGAALCDNRAGKVYVRLSFASLADCVAEVGSRGRLEFDPRTVVFDLLAKREDTRCVPNVLRNGVVSYMRLDSAPCDTRGRTPFAPAPRISVDSPVPLPPSTPHPPAAVPWFPEDDDSAPTWMIITFVLLVSVLVVVCVWWAILKAKDATEPMTEDHLPDWPKVQSAAQGAYDAVGFPGQAPPSAPPLREMAELEANAVVARDPAMNPIHSTFKSTPYKPSIMHDHAAH